jgi:hypothetical protein
MQFNFGKVELELQLIDEQHSVSPPNPAAQANAADSQGATTLATPDAAINKDKKRRGRIMYELSSALVAFLTFFSSYIDHNLQHMERAAMVLIYAFCIRLQSEQYGYIYKFLERHLSLHNAIRIPVSWHESLDPEEDTVCRIASQLDRMCAN